MFRQYSLTRCTFWFRIWRFQISSLANPQAAESTWEAIAEEDSHPLQQCAQQSLGMWLRYLLGLSPEDADRPVGCGSTWPMDGYASYPQLWRRNAADMMGETALSPEHEESNVDGPTLLADLLANSPEPVLILAIGSMTNIATVLKLSPHLKKKVEMQNICSLS